MTGVIEARAPLQIGYKKTCTCPDNHISCVSAKEWVKGMVTIQTFYYTGRDIRDKDVHPAVYPISLPAHFIRLLTHKGELVLDPFVGIGTTLIAAKDLNRNAVGFDLKPEYIEIAKKRLLQTTLESNAQQIAIVDDARNIHKYLEENTVSLCITSPPYANMLNRPRLNKSLRGDLRENGQYLKIQQYSEDERDLGTMNHTEYAEALTEIYAGIFPLLKPRAHCIINVNDVWWENKRYLTHIYVIKALQRAGFEFRNTFIWDKRDLVNNVGIFGWPSNFISLGATMEYILDFWKPPG
ncbi:MAG: DNA methyltransferase [Candidatus Bathyarchaeia archaeon]